MKANLDSEVLIVGAGTGGSYIAWRLAEAGHRCLVLEKEPLDSLGKSIGPFHMEEIAFRRFGIPEPAGEELLHIEEDNTMWSPGFRRSFHFKFSTFVMDKPLFHRRMHGYATAAGAEILGRTEAVGLIRERGMVRGVKARSREGDIEMRGNLVIDASGIDGAVRTLAGGSPWFESGPISARDTIFVYMETWKDVEGELAPGINSFPFHQGWCAPGPGDTRIVGIGMAGSPDAALRRHREMVDRLPFKGTVVGSTAGRIPYRRPPFSLVDNGLMVVGDAAFMNKPFSGEGVTSGLAGCRIAVEVARAALGFDDMSREALWPLNTRYFRDQGARFAFLTAVLPAVMSLGADEMEFLFTVPGVLSEEGSEALQRDFELKQDPRAGLKAGPGIAGGMLQRKLGARSMGRVAYAAALGSQLKRLYMLYPGYLMEFGAWLRRVAPIWRAADRIRYRYFDAVERAPG